MITNSWKQVEWGSGKFIENIILLELPPNRETNNAIEFILNVELVSRAPSHLQKTNKLEQQLSDLLQKRVNKINVIN
jgi:hypothetical protein